MGFAGLAAAEVLRDAGANVQVLEAADRPYGRVWHRQRLVVSGFAGCIGRLCLIQAFRSAPASVVAPFSYSSLLWATLFGYTIWQEIPDAYTWAGASLIIAAGLYIYLREVKLAKT